MLDASHGNKKGVEECEKRRNCRDIKTELTFSIVLVFIHLNNGFGLPLKQHTGLSEHIKCVHRLGKENQLFNTVFILI